ncbi:carbohydrate ABC transporter permease [Faecalicatena orotica]|uniref:carbohydrate ABC transporter permease n=1 Tax=Faecalicatena orotica TaxID=1544 RepID=UPI003217A5AC
MKKAVKAGKILILSLAFLVVAFPFFWCLMLSFKSNAEIMSIPTTFFPSKWILSGYEKVLTEAPFLRWLWNSIFSSVTTTAIVALTSCLGGYIFGKFKFRGKNALFVCVLATMMVPFQVTMIPTYLICSKLHILNSMSALIIPYMVSGFGIFLCRQFVENIPNEVLEAARIDGAGEWRIFFGIVIQSIKPAIAALCIFIFMGRWNDYLWPLVALIDEEKMTLPLALNFFNSSLLTDYCTSMSASVLVMIPIIVIYFLFQKQFVEGITMTGIK